MTSENNSAGTGAPTATGMEYLAFTDRLMSSSDIGLIEKRAA